MNAPAGNRKAAMKAWREANSDRIKAYQKQWRAKNAEAVRSYQKDYHEAYRIRPETMAATWKRSLRKNYQMTPDEFNALWVLQGGQCAICSEKMMPRGRSKSSVSIDHNHQTKKVRGLLCRHCNHGIGALKDSPAVLVLAAMYLEERGHYSEFPLDQGAEHE